jgi:WD40 repeat protein
MAALTDLLLTDPGEAAVAAALDRAAPSHLRGPARWRALLDEVAANADGRSQIETSGAGSGARYVSVAWWTDHRGSKHVRVCGGDTSDPSWQPHYSSLDDDLRPPLWHAFMGRAFRVTRRNQGPRWLVSCACGMTGEPAELAWMGERCGPCHDRREEGQPHPDDGRPALFTGPGGGVTLAFSPDGRELAAASGGYSLRLCDLVGGYETVLNKYETDDDSRRDSISPLLFSTDEPAAVGGLTGEWLIHWWDLHDRATLHQSPGEMMIQQADGEEASGFAFSADGRLLASWSNQGHFIVMTAGGESLEDKGWRVRCNCTALAFSPDGRTLALGDSRTDSRWHQRIRFLDTYTWEERRGLEFFDLADEEEFHFIDYTPDGGRLVCITGDPSPEALARPPRRQLHLFDLSDRKAPDLVHTLPFHTRTAAVTPDGRYLAYVVHDDQHSPGEILFFDLVEWVEAGRLEWDPEDAVNDLAFSADGQTMATISAASVVKLWPWRLLLEG